MSALVPPSPWGVAGLSVMRSGRIVLEDVSMDVPAGSTAAVVGGDGAGKTTLLRALVGSMPVAAGVVRRPARTGIGYVSAAPGGYGDLTVEENLLFSARVYRVPAADRAARITELLTQMQLDTASDRLTEHLSGGMRRKLGVAMGVIHRPSLLVLDEPTTGIDPVGRAELWQIIGRLAAAGTAIAFSTTYLDEAERAGSVTMLSDGRVLLAGPPDAVIASIPGTIRTGARKPESGFAWRHGAEWRVWLADGAADADGTEPAAPTLEDAAIVAQVREERAAAAAADGQATAERGAEAA